MDTPQAYVWRLQNFVIGEHILTPSSSTATPIKVMPVFICMVEILIVD
jgi:U3 small nucleolar RNA-associated protein 21